MMPSCTTTSQIAKKHFLSLQTTLLNLFRMRLSIMQPYIFPYIGYFNLIEATEKIILYDDVNYIKNGWINRNRILSNGVELLFSIPIQNASQNKLINQTNVIIDQKFIKKSLSQLTHSYCKAPNFKHVYDLFEQVITDNHTTIADMAIDSIIKVYQYLEKEIVWDKSSSCSPYSKGMARADRLIEICKEQACSEYVNPIGGQTLYDKQYFGSKGIELHFLKTKLPNYTQFNHDFVPGLSIIDVLMFNDKKTCLEMFKSYELV
jgi:hypothetical protein